MWYLIEIRTDDGSTPLSLRVPATARDAALALAVDVLKTLRHHPHSSGHTLTLRVL